MASIVPTTKMGIASASDRAGQAAPDAPNKGEYVARGNPLGQEPAANTTTDNYQAQKRLSEKINNSSGSNIPAGDADLTGWAKTEGGQNTLEGIRGRTDQYQGSGETGTGFVNFNRYLNANRGAAENAAKNWAGKSQKSQESLLGDLASSEARTEEDIKKGTTKGTEGASVWAKGSDYTVDTSAPKSEEDTAGNKIAAAAIGSLNPTTSSVDLIDQGNNILRGGDTKPVISAAERAVKDAQTNESLKDLPPTGNYVSPDVAAQNAGATYSGPTGWEDQARMLQKAQEAAGRAQNLGSYEGLASMARDAGATQGGSVLDAALIGAGGIGAEQLKSQAISGGQLGNKVNAANEQVLGAIERAQGQSGKNAEMWQQALDTYKAKEQARADAYNKAQSGKLSKSWSDYTGGVVGRTTRNVVNPARMWESHGDTAGNNPLYGQSQGVENTIGMDRMASFNSDEQDVYESMTQDELVALENMTPQEQRAWITNRKNQVRSGHKDWG